MILPFSYLYSTIHTDEVAEGSAQRLDQFAEVGAVDKVIAGQSHLDCGVIPQSELNALVCHLFGHPHLLDLRIRQVDILLIPQVQQAGFWKTDPGGGQDHTVGTV